MDATGISIGPAGKDDADALGVFGARLMALHHDWDPARFLGADDRTQASYAAHLRRQMEEPDVIVLAVRVGDDLVGYSYSGLEGYDYMSLRGPAGVIHDIFIEEGRRRSGLGRALQNATTTALFARGVTQIVLTTAFKNTGAQRLFAAAGLRPTMLELTLTSTLSKTG